MLFTPPVHGAGVAFQQNVTPFAPTTTSSVRRL